MTNRHPNDRRRDRGFTLIEIMVVIVILGILATLAAKNVFGIFGESQEKLAQTKVKLLHEDCLQYRIKYGKFPSSLEDLVTKDDKGFAIETDLPKDPWGHDYVLRQGSRPDDFEVLSFGPDGSEGTEDDITSKPKNDK